MSNAYFKVPVPVNEPVKSYAPGSPERAELQAKLAELKSQVVDIPLIIGGKEIRTGDTAEIRAPHNHELLLGRYHKAGAKEVEMAVEAAITAQKSWADMPWEHRASVFLDPDGLAADRDQCHRRRRHAPTRPGTGSVVRRRVAARQSQREPEQQQARRGAVRRLIAHGRHE